MFNGFAEHRITTPEGMDIFARSAGAGPAVLLLHGYPQTHACWHRVAPGLVEAGFHVVVSDLRGYGRSSKPADSDDHAVYSKRAMAADQVALMAALGHARFMVAGHDRGGRVALRMARDHARAVQRLAVLDIAPTDQMYAATDMEFATAYYHWFFLIQPAPLPERMIGADPEFYLRKKLGHWSRSAAPVFDPAAVADYLRAFSDPACIAGSCADYRAAASIDLDHDAADAGRLLEMPVMALWGDRGFVGRKFDVLDCWRKVARNVRGHAVPQGHFLPEEAPAETLAALQDFFSEA
ncbi:alpha/beta hydrolase [Rhodobacteraceae bacterium 2376]|uniref:Alpha/beta hydrolase n=1 Tax=Rhabdonatronobacter sediminivivens TaxID=2743469 RepID=A0A7Z0KYX5_9RHOB|nr:alpha/beta hydrolase [Rhabdonatronobacter sediminivivens]NYS25774.1 alpha/beta hydrolase [Rhabdonatronobacter sediminivivens]